MRKYYISNRRDEQTCEWPQITLGLYISLQCLLSLGKNAVLFILSFIGENKDSWVIVLVKALLWLTLFSLFKIVKPHQIQGSTLKKNLLHIELGRARVVSHWPQKKKCQLLKSTQPSRESSWEMTWHLLGDSRQEQKLI